MKKVAINGFGRIGRCVLRAYFENLSAYEKDFEIVAINDLTPIETNVHLLKHDSVHGHFNGTVEIKDNAMIINGKEIKVFSERDANNLPWKDMGVEVVMECTGIFNSKEKAQPHFNAGAKKVILSAPAKDDTKTVVMGVNTQDLLASDTIISNGSCTTNCLAPIAKILDRELGIVKGHMTTIHAYTNDQRTVDCAHNDLRRARCAGVSMIPTSTGAAKAVGLVLPQLKGKLDGVSIRVPTPDVSFVDLSFEAGRDTTVEEINEIIKKAAEGELKGILRTESEPLVSIDFTHDKHSSIFDLSQTKVLGENFVRVGAWYDNEWGFSNRMLDSVKNWINLK